MPKNALFEYRYKEEYGKVIPVCPRCGEPDPVMQCGVCRHYSLKYGFCIARRKKMSSKDFACLECFSPVDDDVEEHIDRMAEALMDGDP